MMNDNIGKDGARNMRQSGPGGRRPRGRHHNGGQHSGGQGGERNGNVNASQGSMGGNRPRSAASLRHQTFDSNGPDVRVRGNAWQVYEKYQSLARDATGSGDRVLAENYQQHAEHYYRIIEAINEATMTEQRTRNPSGQPFGAQPDVPSNYYAPDGTLAQPQPQTAMPGEQPQPQPQLMPMAEAEVRVLTPPPSLFTPEEIEEHAGNDGTLLAQRSV